MSKSKKTIIGLRKSEIEKDKAARIAREELEKASEEIKRRIESEVGPTRALVLFCDLSGSTPLNEVKGIGAYVVSFVEFFEGILSQLYAPDARNGLEGTAVTSIVDHTRLEVLRVIGDEVMFVQWLSGPGRSSGRGDGKKGGDNAAEEREIIKQIVIRACRTIEYLSTRNIHVKITIVYCDQVAKGDVVKRVIKEVIEEDEGGGLNSLRDALRRMGACIPPGDIWGADVNRAARIASLAGKHQILLNDKACQILFGKNTPPAACLPFSGKGIETDLEVAFLSDDLWRKIAAEGERAKGLGAHLVTNYGFGALALFFVKSTGKDNVKHFLETLYRHFPWPMVPFAYQRIAWHESDLKVVQDGLDTESEIVLTGLLSTTYIDFSWRVSQVISGCQYLLDHSVTYPLWDPTPRRDVESPRVKVPVPYDLPSYAHAFYAQADDPTRINEELDNMKLFPEYAHFSLFTTGHYDRAMKIATYEVEHRDQVPKRLRGRFQRGLVILGEYDTVLFHKVDRNRIEQPYSQVKELEYFRHYLDLRELYEFATTKGSRPNRLVHWIGKRLRPQVPRGPRRG